MKYNRKYYVDPIQETIRQKEQLNRTLDSRLHCNGSPGIFLYSTSKIVSSADLRRTDAIDTMGDSGFRSCPTGFSRTE